MSTRLSRGRGSARTARRGSTFSFRVYSAAADRASGTCRSPGAVLAPTRRAAALARSSCAMAARGPAHGGVGDSGDGGAVGMLLALIDVIELCTAT